eukprot:XP_011668002.1 PREDICTED: uncharacterized protein LOC105440026 [Strongylocentrotus purpuratus]
MTVPLFTVLVVLFYIVGCTEACSLTSDWEPWNITRRTQRADVVIIGTVIGYYPMFQDNASPLFYRAEVDVSCVFGVRTDASVIARGIVDNNGVVNVVGFNPRMVQCPTSQVDIADYREYILWVIGEWSGGDMRPQEINAQPAVVNATTSILAEFSEAMTSGSHMGYRMKSRKCSVDTSVEVVDVVSTTTTKEGTRITPKRVVGTGNGHRLEFCQMSLLLSILIIIVL